jgi:acetate CoA/acetoacetate CoA-transferase beta subunit
VIVAMEHCTRDGGAKIVPSCVLPLTAVNCVDLIVTEMAVFRRTSDGLMLEELGPDVSLEDVRAKTSARFYVAPNVRTMALER